MREILQNKLEILSQDELMKEAIKILFYDQIEKEKPNVEKTDDDKVLGEKFRAYEKASSILNGVFFDIETYNKKKIDSKEFNKGK